MACLAGLGTYVERLCALCEAGSSMGALWSQQLGGGGGGAEIGGGAAMVQRLRTVLKDLHSLAQLEATQLNMHVQAASKQENSAQVGEKF